MPTSNSSSSRPGSSWSVTTRAQIAPTVCQASRRRRSAPVTVICAGSNETSRTVVPGRASKRLNAVVTRTGVGPPGWGLDTCNPTVWPVRGTHPGPSTSSAWSSQHLRVPIEDLAQVQNIYPEAKYSGNYETVAALVYRGRDAEALREFARRLAFTILIANGDGHLKNWSLIYRDARTPTLSPAYDLVATAPYREHLTDQETLALKFGGSRRFRSVRLTTFTRLQHRLSAPTADLGLFASSCGWVRSQVGQQSGRSWRSGSSCCGSRGRGACWPAPAS